MSTSSGPVPRIDFRWDRPPAPYGSRPWGLFVAAAVVVYVAVILLVLLFSLEGSAVALGILFAGPAAPLVAFGIRLSASRFGGDDGAPAAPYRTESGAEVGYGGEHPRRPDREEREAWKALKRGRISRVQFERIRARRHLAHGEIDRLEYQAIIAQLDEVEHRGAGPRRV